MKRIYITAALVALLSVGLFAQIPVPTLVQISKAEDELRFDQTLETLLQNRNPKIRERAALAAGRIGNDTAVPMLAGLINSDESDAVRVMAMFAIGEVESIKGADVVLSVLSNTRADGAIRARAIEAAGKIGAANSKHERSKELSKAIVEALEFESGRRSMPNRDTIVLGLTAVLRTRPDGGDAAAARFLGYSDERVRSDAANTLTRIRAKNANRELRSMLKSDTYAIARANAARALGAAEDKDSLSDLLAAAISDSDSRVRVSAIRSVAALKDGSAREKLIERGNALLVEHKRSKFANPAEKNELLEIATALGRLAQNTNDEKTVGFLSELRKADKFVSPETEIALARVAPDFYVDELTDEQSSFSNDWRASSSAFQALGEIAVLPKNDVNDPIKLKVKLLLIQKIGAWLESDVKLRKQYVMAFPDLLRAFAAFKSESTSNIIRPLLEAEPDEVVRATVAEILAEQKPSKENLEALGKAFTDSLLRDKFSNDATIAIMDALFKIDKAEASGWLLTALSSSDYLVRKKAFQLLSDEELQKSKPGIPTIVEYAIARKRNLVSSFSSGSKLGIIRNTNADYARAVSRKNGTVTAVFATEKGRFTIALMPEDAPLTVDNFIRLARANYFNGLAVHRVVPNFVMQDGDNRGDGNGGPGWSIRCEVNTLPYERGAVGMALSGKDTGGSQWFVTHSPQPHLDGGYTVFGRVPESDMKVVDSIVRGDKILSVKIIGR
ncbi:MAG: peptidylprolyl isomerase [Acidobacteria bacterium]|nr:peptidylprolyl isomerase [Acidobacteriota bacterium]